MNTTTSTYQAMPMIVKGMYIVRGASLYYILDTRPIEGLLLLEDCFTTHCSWEKANVVRKSVKEVIKLTV
jgi:hypothetical protein